MKQLHKNDSIYWKNAQKKLFYNTKYMSKGVAINILIPSHFIVTTCYE